MMTEHCAQEWPSKVLVPKGLAEAADDIRKLANELLPTHPSLVVSEMEGEAKGKFEFQIVSIQKEVHSLLRKWAATSYRQQGEGQLEMAKSMDELEAERISDREICFVRRTNDGSCRWGCGKKFAMRHDKRRTHESQCRMLPANAVAVPDKQ